ncbi:peripheral-type benzodiazepine receptor-associated protein 1 isoform X3 [Hippocampus zosterae]|uniref:peripheral-type benzodiazepine receptor-associated protein 1 isoform X3 n=1 Tax=Hippocampus zosterae TaxID=109293 RepID=UPI00223D9E04|nr:peripheral-type benzodiazepine receptor-associated protein 1 isoform X3 [Hippocampus zosterae]
MRKDGHNLLLLSSKKPCQGLANHGPELETLNAVLEVKEERTEQALSVAIRHPREPHEHVQEVTSRHACRKNGHSNRLRCLFKDRGRHTNIEAGSSTRETRLNLEQLLLMLSGKINSEQGVYKLHKQELELEKAIVLCHLLDTHQDFLHKRQLVRQFAQDDSSFNQLVPHLNHSRTSLRGSKIASCSSKIKTKQNQQAASSDLYLDDACTTCVAADTCWSSALKICHPHNTSHAERNDQAPYHPQFTGSDVSPPSKCMDRNMASGADYRFLVRQNFELLRALDELKKTCSILREENCLLRKSSAPETEEKVRRLRRKNTELAVLAKRLEERARKLQEANLKMVNSPSLIRPGSVEHYKRAFARQRARDLAQHADTLLCKEKEIAALQQDFRELEARLGAAKGSPVPSSRVEFERLLRESQREVLRLQRQLAVTSTTSHQNHNPDPGGHDKCVTSAEVEVVEEKVVGETPCAPLDESPSTCEKTPGEEEELGLPVTPLSGLSPTLPHQEKNSEERHLHYLESELTKKRKECENLEHEAKKRQKKCLDLESQLEDEQGKNEKLKEEADLLRRKAQLLDQTRVENDELREELSKVTAQHNSVLEENQRLCAKLENLEQVLKHMREVAERRQQLELEHEQALAILKFKQDEIKRLQRAQLFAKREHEGVVQMLEELIQLVLRRELSKVRDLEEKCRSQSEQFGLLSRELEKFRLQASKANHGGAGLLNHPGFSLLTNGVGLSTERDCTDGSWDMESLSEIAFWSLEGGDTLSCAEDVAAALRMGTTPYAAGLSRVERSPVTKHRELPTISVSKSASSSSKSETTNLTPKSETHLSPHKSSPSHEVDTASEVDELDVDMAPAPYTACRSASKLQVFIARYSYNPYDGPNDNPEMELPLTAGEYIYVYGGMDDDGFYEGELVDGRRGLVPSNFVERVSDDDVMGTHPPETSDVTHNSLLDSSLHSASHQHHLHTSVRASDRTEASSICGPASASSNSALAVSAPLTNGLDVDLEEVGVDTVPYPRKLTLIKQLAKSIIISWDPPLVPAGWGNVWSYNVYVDQELRLNVPFGAQTKAVLERLDINLKAYRVSVQSLTEKGLSDQLRCSMLIGRDVCVAPTQLRVDRVTATSANLSWLPSNSNYVHIVSLNEQECELVKAGSYSLCLNNLLPSLQYTVKVEARPHRTPWELPVERRERRSASINFSTRMAGPPDAPLDVQLEHGPSPGIALISWLPVTIDCAGTSNGVRVTGYTIYADKKRVLEVSSPTAGSALLGPSQIQSLQAAQQLTVRTMSAHGESCDSFPVNVPSKLPAIMAGPVATTPVVPPLTCNPVGPTNLGSLLSLGNSAAKASMPPCPSPPDTHISSLTVESAANCPRVPHSEVLVSSATFVKAWADPASAPTAACEATLPVRSIITPVINVTSPTLSAPQAPPVVAPTQTAEVVAAAMMDQRRDADSPGTIRPFPSITEFIEDPCAKLVTPERIPTPPKAPITDLLNPLDTLILRPPSTSPLDSEVEEEQENKRLVSVEEFLREDQDPIYTKGQQSYGAGLVEPPGDYVADSIRSDLSDILEEEEEELYSDHLMEAPTRGYTVTAGRVTKSEPSDSDEDVLERILKLPTQPYRSKQLFSIPEVTEEEDGGRKEPLHHHIQIERRLSHLHPRSMEHLHRAPQCHHRPHVPPQHHHFNRSFTKEPLMRQGPLEVKPKLQHRVHYSDAVDIVSYSGEKEVGLCVGPANRRGPVRCPPYSAPNKDRVLLRGLGDRLRREAMLRSQKAAAAAASKPGHGPTPPRPCPVSKTVRTVKSPISRGMEIDVEYGTDDNEEPDACPTGEVVLGQMRSEWWIEGAEMEHRVSSYRQGRKPESVEPSEQTESAAGPSWGTDSELSPKSVVSQGRQLKGCFESPKTKGDNSDFRIFVALFPYDPATMSPNPDAAEEELPFREGQIITVYGEKDSDGFYRGESAGRLGYVPCNMVSEIQVEDEETRQQLLQQGFLTTPASIEKIGTRTHAQHPSRPVPPPKPRRSKKAESSTLLEESVDSSRQDVSQAAAATAANSTPGSRRMVAIFDYDPRESSPNTDIEAELTFSAGDVIHVIGDMDEDGFFYGDLNGQRGLVPSNFLQALPEDAPAEHVSAKPAAEPKKESQGNPTDDQQDPGPSASQDTLIPQIEPPCPNLSEHSEPLPHLQLPASTTPKSCPVTSSAPAHASPPAPHPADRPVLADCSAQGKKKKGFFSKGKKLFKRFGSSKKD